MNVIKHLPSLKLPIAFLYSRSQYHLPDLSESHINVSGRRGNAFLTEITIILFYVCLENNANEFFRIIYIAMRQHNKFSITER